MREMTKAQDEVLRLIASAREGKSKGQLVGSAWRIIDRLEAMGLVARFRFSNGPRYLITDAGRTALACKDAEHG